MDLVSCEPVSSDTGSQLHIVHIKYNMQFVNVIHIH